MQTETQHLLHSDLLGIADRIDTYKKQVAAADHTVVTLVCSDSRVSLPQQLVNLTNQGNKTDLAMVGVPTIGGGAPSRMRVRGVVRQLLSWGVNPERINLLATQHGDSAEIESAEQHHDATVSCGLRKFFAEHETELCHIRKLLLLWSRQYKRELQDKKAAPDRQELSTIEEKAPGIMQLVNTLHQQTGLPRRLIIRAAYRNSSFDIEHNLVDTWATVVGYLDDPEFDQIFSTCLVAAADYDHQQKTLHFNLPFANMNLEQNTLELPELPSRTDTIQNPENVIISFGEESICLHNGIILPSFAHSVHKPDNVFRACASIPTVPTILCAFAEAYYAVIHKVKPHPGNGNFTQLQRIIVVCDTNRHVDVVKQALHSTEFQSEFLPAFALLPEATIHVVNLNHDQINALPETFSLAIA